ncbi:MAG: hypothetical protein ABIJ34_02020 [archaeon]
MSGGYPAQQGGEHHGLKHAGDHGHYPDEELLKEVGSRTYKLKPHEEANIKEIESRLRNSKEMSHHELHEYQHFLEHMTHELKDILQEEAGEHIHNLQLEKDLRKVAQLLGEVSAVLDRH